MSDRTAAMRPAVTADGAAVILAAIINADPRPLVQILQMVTGQAVLRLQVKDHGAGELTMPGNLAELDALDAPEGTPARWRTGQLVTETGLAAAEVSLIWLPHRIPAEARALLEAGKRPAGHILGPLGATRHWCRARALNGAGVKSQAVLYLGGLPVALAAEEISYELCEVIASNWERCLPGCG
jgi:hypothetical protein